VRMGEVIEQIAEVCKSDSQLREIVRAVARMSLEEKDVFGSKVRRYFVVEHQLPKLRAAGSNPVARSRPQLGHGVNPCLSCWMILCGGAACEPGREATNHRGIQN